MGQTFRADIYRVPLGVLIAKGLNWHLTRLEISLCHSNICVQPKERCVWLPQYSSVACERHIMRPLWLSISVLGHCGWTLQYSAILDECRSKLEVNIAVFSHCRLIL